MDRTRQMRTLAALIALIAWAAIFGQMALNFAAAPANGTPSWMVPVNLYGYFTIWANTLVALAATHAARGGSETVLLGRPGSRAAVVVYIVVVGTIYHTLLAGLRHLAGLPWLIDHMLHTVVPLAWPLWWLAFRSRAALSWSILPGALVVPTLYSFWAMGRGAMTGKYAYFFIDIGKYGVPTVLINIAGLVLLFAGLMAALIAFDRRGSSALKPQES